MRRPEVALAPAPSDQTPPALGSGLQTRSRSSTGAPAPPPTDGSGGWALPPLNQFMTLPGRFLASRFGGPAGSSPSPANSSPSSSSGGSEQLIRSRNLLGGAAIRSTSYGSTLDNLLHDGDEDWAPHDHFVLPHMLHFQDVYEPVHAATGPADRPEEIDLTVSSSEGEDEDGAQNAGEASTGDSDDAIEILEPSGAPLPTPLRRKRRRPAPGAAATNGNALLVPKRQRVTDITRSAESTNISIENSEAVEEFKSRLKCSVCLDVLEDMTSTICGHIFCAGCIHQAIRANSKCPLCQRRLHLKDTHRLFF